METANMDALKKMYDEYLICHDRFLALQVEYERASAEMEPAVKAFCALDVKKTSKKEWNTAEMTANDLVFKKNCVGIKYLAEAKKVIEMAKRVNVLQELVKAEMKAAHERAPQSSAQ